MTLPNFLIIGAQKSGTTSLHDILSQHPQANMSEVKEINFFTDESKYKKGLNYYKTYFKNPGSNHKITGESSPGYICYPKVPERILNDLGKDVKLVLILRDPIKRAFSQYWNSRRNLRQHLTEQQVIDKYLSHEFSEESRNFFSRGAYIKYIKEYLKYIDEAHINIIVLEELIHNQKKGLQELYRFLGIDIHDGLQELPKPLNPAIIYKNPFYMFFFNNPYFQIFLPKRGRSILYFGKKEKYKYQLPESANLEKLKAFYRPYNEELSAYLGKPLNYWM